jgi:hypothetical protein
VVAGAVDRFDHREFAIAETEDAMCEARDHQLQVALIAPEPGQFIVGLRLADEGGPKNAPIIQWATSTVGGVQSLIAVSAE